MLVHTSNESRTLQRFKSCTFGVHIRTENRPLYWDRKTRLAFGFKRCGARQLTNHSFKFTVRAWLHRRGECLALHLNKKLARRLLIQKISLCKVIWSPFDCSVPLSLDMIYEYSISCEGITYEVLVRNLPILLGTSADVRISPVSRSAKLWFCHTDSRQDQQHYIIRASVPLNPVSI